MDPQLAVRLCGLELTNPVIAASGTLGYGVEFLRLLDLNSLGAVVVKGLSKDPIDGNPAPRLWEAEGGMVNSVGLQNVGVRAFIADKLPGLRSLKTKIFANVFGYAAEDYVEVVKALEDAGSVSRVRTERLLPQHQARGASSSRTIQPASRIWSR